MHFECTMNAPRTIPIMGRVDKETKAWIDAHPLSQSDLINYGLHLIRLAESNIKDANTHMSTITIEPKPKDLLPF